ncbi:MAG: hypothetical protein UY61_C0039G0002 [Candidatus Adlerbacteria bacterium GW2011_GWC1_50_9]|uniref:EamA domain-containing protein n=1 Tax=Candidatus Adlerbacteria bacterium GW2011_GWC1_50_9 TaxID=1618608 RepID=A0A0G1WNY7_9BACT|nr:MAG: hypothetical protein UY61_C0039G0002 [Candidatus Adlerbacteria bacterium GW2011_GWC1_50_9]
MWLVFALFGHLMNAFVFLTDKAFVEKIFPSPKALAFISGASGIFTFALFPWFLTGGPSDAVFASIFSGAITVVALVFFFTAVGRDEISRVVPATGSLTPISTFLGGIVIAFRSFWSLFRKKDFSLFGLELFVAFLFAVGFVTQKYGFNGLESDFSSFLWARAGGVLAALPLLFYSDVRARLNFSEIRSGGAKKGILYAVSRIFAGISPLVITVAISFGSATLVNATQGVQYVFLYLLAILFSRRFPDIFKEGLDRGVVFQKSIALVLIVIGLILVS